MTSFFETQLAHQTDVSDVRAALATGEPGFTLIDSRSRASWDQAHIPGARHLPAADIPAGAPGLLDPAVPVVTYCWGPGCNGATRSALALTRAGYEVKEMIGGIEYWIREGFPVRTPDGDVALPPDPRVAPVDRRWALAALGAVPVAGPSAPVTAGLVLAAPTADACGC
ncbi:hypothetical protein Aab01nite_74300 [Paractinoplanes abujensis]|uniref:Rhodanese-related sulfurtransferase n=1 Tax=Paractinoplanes abujensis TaxID=882441 RepID=A0A7W7G2D0_9ACTN|nr:rhodanese-like domain-containing protein [Actinoplanes abujensis]MBB4695108.1 rhodanese-related sulfurtransferase [Actinoplanes abujensis]GID23840.1 hypothetical protein Aab01nite_74300 [Actinoplanes abujensis]